MCFHLSMCSYHRALNVNTCIELNIVRSSVTTESQPASLTKVTVAVLLELVYCFHLSMCSYHSGFERQHLY